METNKKIGVYWGKETIFFVEMSNQKVERFFHLPLKKAPMGAVQEDGFIHNSLELIATIKNTFRQQKIQTSHVNVALPIKDIIFRSFIIPWMQTSEIKGVVAFEATKYIPFAIEELSYSFYPMKITQNGIRRIRIIFVAIKKDALENYSNIFEQAELSATLMEPAPVSLIRTLMLKEIIPENDIIALIESERDVGKITILDQSIPQFVREFKLKPLTNQITGAGPAELTPRLINEIRISLDYFNRQENQTQVKQIILVTPEESKEVSNLLEKDLSIPVKAITCKSITNNFSNQNIGYLNAYGAGLTGTVNTTANFNLQKNNEKSKQSKRNLAENVTSYKPSIISAAACAIVILILFFTTKMLIGNPQKAITNLNQQLGTFKGASTIKLKEKNDALNDKLTKLKKIKTESHVSVFLSIIPGLLPKGAWIQDFDVIYSEAPTGEIAKKTDWQPSINLTGFAYLKNTKEQFSLVNKLVRNLKQNTELSNVFTHIDLETVRSQKLNDFPVTFFRIKLQ